MTDTDAHPSTDPPRLPHAALDADSRRRKAEKILAVLAPHARLEGARVLDIGAGSGHVAAAISRAVGENGGVWGVDTVDQRQLSDGFRFTLVDGPRLPFDDRSFDLVVSNHVVEHVGTRERQIQHLTEIARVLDDRGVVYLATPNRWSIIEPHYRLPLLSWLPVAFRSPYVRATRRGQVYDCDPLDRRELTDLFRTAHLAYRDATWDAMRAMSSIEPENIGARALLRVPSSIRSVTSPILPTMIYMLRKR